MPRTLAELESLLTTKGYQCRRISDVSMMAELPTKAYTNATGDRSIEVRLAFDRTHARLTLDTPRALVRLRVDCRCGAGVEPDNVLQMLSLIPECADRWHPFIAGRTDKSAHAHSGGKASAELRRLESIARRAGGINRLERLFWLRHHGN